MWSPDQGGIYAASIVLILGGTASVALRFVARRLCHASIEADDWTILFALVLVWALAAMNILGAAAGSYGTHTAQAPSTGKTIPTWHENQVAKLSYVAQVIVVAADGVIKLSLLLMYKRIFVGRTFQLIFRIVAGFVVIWTVVFFFGTVFVCGRDPAWQWTSPATIAAHCGSIKYVWLSHAVTDVATDIIIMAIPIPLIWQLNMRTAQKLGIMGIFALGFFSTGAGITRLVYVAEDVYETTTGFRDVRAVQTNIGLWAMIEAGVGVITACLVTFKPLLKTRPVESIVNSVRSAFELGSRGESPSRKQQHPSDVSSDVPK